jgi:hypothetical protein
MHLESTSLEGNEVVHLLVLVHVRAELLSQVEIVGGQLVLGVPAAAVVAVAA